MAVTIELRRHTDNDGDVLTPDGIAAALALGGHLADHVGTEWGLAVSTGAQRATQTVGCMLAGGGLHVAGGVDVVSRLRSDDEDRWRAAYRSAGSGHLDDLAEADPDFVAAEVATLGAALATVGERLSDGDRGLVVGHSPTNEAAVLGLSGVTVDPLGKGEGVVLVGAGSDWEVAAASMP